MGSENLLTANGQAINWYTSYPGAPIDFNEELNISGTTEGTITIYGIYTDTITGCTSNVSQFDF